MRRGFKAEAERRAVEVRGALGLDHRCRLDCDALAAYLKVKVMTLADFRVVIPDDVEQLEVHDREAFSAVTVIRDGRHLVVMNHAHSAARQANTLTHELAHILLNHQPCSAFDGLGSRNFPDELEAEASYQAGSLLAPRNGLIEMFLVHHESLAKLATHYGISIELMRERWHSTGAARQLERRGKR